ncbi:hypothetical protein BCR32DRAFT_329648 [Anaeromyces robustus]|uniref:Uncharacterized protein n=1 Tax=Anaeromyces robustus TaxID=1754192 RepID=A0A1Y1WQN9_9FUNG|nr:hypothetical protein BCR32DRAFT_329648 [Anaeromyces robustus]|eukprot:ORX75792.1 hypothetical protein BCR32DRAFT_329648 [Anaeromyces robustus]
MKFEDENRIENISIIEDEENEEDEEDEILEENSSQPLPSSFIFTEDIDETITSKFEQKHQQKQQQTNFGREYDSNSNQKLYNNRQEKGKFDVLHHTTSPLNKNHSFKKKNHSPVASPIFSKNNIHLSPVIQRKNSPLSYNNSFLVRNNKFSSLSRIEEDGSSNEQNHLVPNPGFTHTEENHDFSIGTDISRNSDSTTATEYKNIPNPTDQSVSIVYNKSSLSISSDDDDFDDEEIISVDINLISQDDASTYNSPLLFPVVTPPNYEQLLKDQFYKI